MPERPLLALPTAVAITRPVGHPTFVPFQKPTPRRQRRRLEAKYQVLRNALASPQGLVSLRADPTSIAPHRAIVFDIAGSVANFYKAAKKVPGLEFITEEDLSFEPDDDFAMLEDDLPSDDLRVDGRRYLAMPSENALKEIVDLYRAWRRGRKLPKGFTPWRDVFLQLKDLRPWGPQDRISNDAIAVWEEELATANIEEVSVEAEFFFYPTAGARAEVLDEITGAVGELNGEIVRSAAIPEIAYHAALVKLPASAVQHLINRDHVQFVLADQIMFIRPQSRVRGPVTEAQAPTARTVPQLAAPAQGSAIAALLDGFPVQNHTLLANRLNIDDADGLEPLAVVGQRHHGTAMASLILHGDLNAEVGSLARPLHVHPILYASAPGREEETSPDRLLVDTIYRAVVRMKDAAAAGGPTASDVFLINLSLGDRRRSFSGPMSPLGRLLDYLASHYNVLFLVSAGNVTSDVALPGFNTLTEVEAAAPDIVTRAFLQFVRDQQAHRGLLAPAESLNPLTIGAAHDDSVAGFAHTGTIAPYASAGFPNVSSALGLGHRRVVKPDILFPGGRERLRLRSSPPLVLRIPDFAQGFGLRAAAPDPTPMARLDRRTLTCGTSGATALATRAGHLIFDGMMDAEAGSNLSDVPSEYWPVVVKALLVHSARWPEYADLIADIFGPPGSYRHAERADNVSRLIGYGIPDIARVMECSPNQATLVGFGQVSPTIAHEYRVPLPQCLEAVTEPRTIVLTLAWFSPVTTVFQDYRRAQLLVDAPVHREEIGVRRLVGKQPSDHASKRGSLIHEVYSGQDAVAFLDDGFLQLRVWCREKPSTARLKETIRYGLAITIEAGVALPIYEQVDVRLRALVHGEG